MSEKIEKLIKALNEYIDMGDSGSSVSPTSPPADMDKSVSASLYLTESTSFSEMSYNDLLLAHTLLHKFFATGNKNLTKSQIIDLHKEVREHIKHERFDKLDTY